MDLECKNEHNSEEFVEFIFREGKLARKIISSVGNFCISSINSKWAVLSASMQEASAILSRGTAYAEIPGIYGLSDLSAENASGILAVREQPVLGLKGQGTYIAVIDTGIRWRHEAFINENNTTKIEILWDQESGKIFTSDDINAALRGANIDIPGDEIGHGTFLAGIAAGKSNDKEGFSGVAPYARLIVVKLRQAKNFLRNFYFVKEGAPAYSEVDLMTAVRFVADYVNNKEIPVSLCMGVGTSLGSHSGASPLASMLADEAGKIGTCVTLASGNEGNERLHFHGVVTESQPRRVELKVGENENGIVGAIWSYAPEVYSIEIISPSGQLVRKIPSSSESVSKIDFIFEGTTVYVYYRQYEGLAGSNIIVLRFDKPAAGIWDINVYGRDLINGEFDMWLINREFLAEDTYLIESDPNTTITDPANEVQCIGVSAYNHKDMSIYLKNGRGYNWYNAIKPDFAAPGVQIIGPSSLSNNNYTTRSGTSVAAAFYAGMAALIQEYGIIRGNIPTMRTAEIKNITISGCIRKTGITYPNREWGDDEIIMS